MVDDDIIFDDTDWSIQERRAKEKKIEEAKKMVHKANAEKRKTDLEIIALAEEPIAKDETEEGQAAQDCEVLFIFYALVD